MLNTAFVFPGQGSQSVGMLSDFLPQYPLIREVFAEVSDAVGYDVWQLVQKGPEEQLNQTQYTQVALLSADVAIYRLLLQQGLPAPQMMAGHSLGEYAALVCAHSLSLRDAALLVASRGQIMQRAIPLGVGAMAAVVGLMDEEVKSLCTKASQGNLQVSPANYNAIGQIVVAGHLQAVEKLIDLALASGAKLAKKLPVSVPCHCPLLLEAAEWFAECLAKVELKKPSLAVVSNVDLGIYHSVPQLREKLKEQLYSPVRWVETIQLFKQQGMESIIECGPGKVLSGLIKRIDRNLPVMSVHDTISLDLFLKQLQISAGEKV